MEDTIARLSAPIDPSKVKSRQGDGGGTVFYIERATVIERLNAVLGEAWSFDWEVINIKTDGDWVVKGALTVNGETRSCIGWGELKVSKKTGRPVYGGPEKAAVTDALKRAASLWGVGAELYEDDYHPQRVAQPAQDDKETKLIMWASRQGLNVDQLDRALGAHPSEFDGTGEDAVALVKAFKARVQKEVPSWVDEKPQRGKFYATLSDMAIEEDEFKQWANAASMREYATLDDALAELNVYVEYKLNEHVSDWNGQN